MYAPRSPFDLWLLGGVALFFIAEPRELCRVGFFHKNTHFCAIRLSEVSPASPFQHARAAGDTSACFTPAASAMGEEEAALITMLC